MSLEDAIKKLTEAVEANTKAHQEGGGAAAASAKTPAKGKGAAAAKSDGPSRDEVNAALQKLKEEKGVKDAKGVIKDVGKAAAMAEIKESEFAAVIAKCEELLNAEGGDDDM